ncbi:hypothetical protein GCM10009730_34890 [Streptomyces albidochromogenes]|uniref:HEAT repeat domain-containing protein n=1 Tax=Streptomyces albidochromogenes TaxID=329524 RepID=UPI00110FBA45|nr:HEAT repeat domain-containing protein [Streptomyces albidochromogenes]
MARLAVRTLCHAGWEPAVPAVIGLLEHGHPAVREAAREGLALMPGPAAPALRYAAAHARPDTPPLRGGPAPHPGDRRRRLGAAAALGHPAGPFL